MIKKTLRKASMAVMLAVVLLFTTAFTYPDKDVKLNVGVENYEGEIVIEPEDESCPMPEVTSKKILGTGTFEWSVNEPGDYYYKVYQIPGKQEGVIYDKTVYEALLSVSSLNDTELEYHFYFFTDKGKPDEIKFVNEKPAPPTPPSPADTVRTDDKPETGDNTMQYLAIAMSCFAVLIVAVILKIKQLKEDSDRKMRGGIN